MDVSQDGEKYINGCRLSSSLLELQPFKVVTAEAKSMTEKDAVTKRHSNNNNNRYKDRRTYSTPGMNEAKAQLKQSKETDSEVPLLLDTNAPSSDEQANRHGNSVSCDNIFESPMLQVTVIPDHSTPKHVENETLPVEYDSLKKLGNSLPKPVIRSPSKEKLVKDSPNHQSTEVKKTKPKKPNRESLRRSRPDIRASHPNLPTSNRSSLPYSGTPEHNLTVPTYHNTLPGHDYEELPADVKILQQRKRISHPQFDSTPALKVLVPDVGFSPANFHSQSSSSAIQERPKNPRQRMNPLYAGMHANPYEQETPTTNSIQKKPPSRCLSCIVVGIILAVLLSLISIAAITLMVLGFIEPKMFDIAGRGESDRVLIEKLQQEIAMLKNASNQTDMKIEDLMQQSKLEILDAVQSLNISALQGPDTADVAKCIHRSFGIGSSSSLDEITSGQYFAEEGYVTTAVTCSPPIGYIAYLNDDTEEYYNGEDDVRKVKRTVYKCICRKTSLVKPVTQEARVACMIHYWQCPIL